MSKNPGRLWSNASALDQVAEPGRRVRTDFPGLNARINNAGHLTDHWQRSADGFELTFAVNYLAPVLLTLPLPHALRPNAPGRIVHVASTAPGGGTHGYRGRKSE